MVCCAQIYNNHCVAEYMNRLFLHTAQYFATDCICLADNRLCAARVLVRTATFRLWVIATASYRYVCYVRECTRTYIYSHLGTDQSGIRGLCTGMDKPKNLFLHESNRQQ